MTTMSLNDLITANLTQIKGEMRWENYDLNDTTIAVTENVKNDAINILKRSYGNVQVESDILADLLTDVFMYFPPLLQSLSITRLIDSIGVVKDDLSSTTITRTENLANEVEQNSSGTASTSNTDTNTLNTTNTTNMTNAHNNTVSSSQESETNIENASGMDATGSRTVNLSHNMPEQALATTNPNSFVEDEQGTPILKASYVQQASEGFSTSNPVSSTETSTQTIDNSDTTSDIGTNSQQGTVATTGTNTSAVVGSASDENESITTSTATNTISETTEMLSTNKQYAYEIKAFLETAQSVNAFRDWVDHFSWIEGII